LVLFHQPIRLLDNKMKKVEYFTKKVCIHEMATYGEVCHATIKIPVLPLIEYRIEPSIPCDFTITSCIHKFNNTNFKKEVKSINHFAVNSKVNLRTPNELLFDEILYLTLKIEISSETIKTNKQKKFLITVEYLEKEENSFELDLSKPREYEIQVDSEGQYQFHIQPSKGNSSIPNKWWTRIKYADSRRPVFTKSEDSLKLHEDHNYKNSGYTQEFTITKQTKIQLVIGKDNDPISEKTKDLTPSQTPLLFTIRLIKLAKSISLIEKEKEFKIYFSDYINELKYKADEKMLDFLERGFFENDIDGK
jgi:hypothetical protein